MIKVWKPALKISMLFAMGMLLTACTTTSTSNAPVSKSKPGTIKRESVVEVQTGVVVDVKKVTVLGKRSGVGNTIGHTLGAIAGGAVGSGYGRTAGSILGGILGGAAGASADRELQRRPGVEIVVRLDTGQRVTVTQLVDKKEVFRSGDRVKLIMKDGQAHVTHR